MTLKSQLQHIVQDAKWDWKPRLQAVIDSLEDEQKESTKGTRTLSQNSALHKDCSMIADKLNESGKDMRVVLKSDYLIPWTTESVKEHIFRPIMKALYNIDSTTQLSKHKEIDKIHDVIMRELGEKHGIEYHEFPHDKKKAKETLAGYKISATEAKPNLEEYYKEEDVTPTF